jgi:hypothetical protein
MCQIQGPFSGGARVIYNFGLLIGTKIRS